MAAGVRQAARAGSCRRRPCRGARASAGSGPAPAGPSAGRRAALLLPPGLLLAGSASPSLASPAPASVAGKRVVITGCNSGIGLDGATKLAAAGARVTMACRTLVKAEAARQEVLAAAPGADVTAAACDLADLSSVRAFAASVEGPVDVLVLNAGLQYSGDKTVRRTADGFELVVGTNHLGHFLLANLLLPRLEAAGGRPRVVVTASEVHDPASPGGAVGNGATLGSLRGLEEGGRGFVMVDGGEYDADKAYKDSKLCNVLFAMELERRLEAAGSRVTVNSFGPGLITRTGFFRYQNPLFVGLFDFAANDIFRVAETVSGGGDCLVYMAADPSLEGVGGRYYNNGLSGFGGHAFSDTAPSEEARDEEEARKLWALSASLVGLDA